MAPGRDLASADENEPPGGGGVPDRVFCRRPLERPAGWHDPCWCYTVPSDDTAVGRDAAMFPQLEDIPRPVRRP